MAVSQWKLTRMEIAEAGVFKETLPAKTQLPLLDRLWQAQGRLERAYARAHRELERIEPNRPRRAREIEEEEPAPQPAAEAPSPAPPSVPEPQPARSASQPAARISDFISTEAATASEAAGSEPGSAGPGKSRSSRLHLLT